MSVKSYSPDSYFYFFTIMLNVHTCTAKQHGGYVTGRGRGRVEVQYKPIIMAEVTAKDIIKAIHFSVGLESSSQCK